jgi:AcrR family transcriptional regulator
MKEQILSVARQQVCLLGYQNLSIRNITKAIGCSSGVVYLYFKNKNDLLEKVYHDFESDFFEILVTQNKCDCPIQYLKNVCFHCLTYSIKKPQQYELIFHYKQQQNHSNKIFADTKIKNICKEIIQECQEKGYLLISQNSEEVFQILWNFMYGLIYLNISKRLVHFQRYNENLSSEILENFIENLFFNRRFVPNTNFEPIYSVLS